MKIQTVNPMKNVHAYLIMISIESNSTRITLYANGHKGAVGIIFDATL